MGGGEDKAVKVGRAQIMQDLRGKAFSTGDKKKREEPGIHSHGGSFKYPRNL